MKKQKLFIGISGKMGTGKSTISHMLQVALQETSKVKIGSLASPIYKGQDLLYKQYGLTLEGEKDRDLLIAIGLWGRGKDSNFWLEQFVKESVESEFEVIICDDVRFENEADFFKKHGVLFRISGEQRGGNLDESRKNHSTEVSLDEYDFDNIISNYQSPAEMCKQIAQIMGGNDGA